MTTLLTRRFTVKDYHRMLEAGILTENDRLELIRGEIIQMSPISPRHAAGVNRLNALFSRLFGDQIIVAVQNPVELDDLSEPQPDLALLRPCPDFYASGHPTNDDVFLLVEVANTTVDYDRGVKIPLYAEDNIQEVWLLDLTNQCLEVYRLPTPDGYQSVQQFYRGQQVSLLAFPDVVILVDEVLG